jgi:predicted secreted protein
MSILGIGTKLEYYESAEYHPIANIYSLTGPSLTKETVDSTALDTPNGYRQFIGSLKNSGTLAFSLLFTSGGYEVIKGFYDSNTSVQFRITLPDKATVEGHGSQFVFHGLVTELPLTVPVEDKVTCDVTVKISGAVTLA